MKRILYSLFAAAAVISAASCNKAQMPGFAEGDEVAVTFNVETLAGLQTKAAPVRTEGISDGTTATHLIYKTFDKDMNLIAGLSGETTLVDLHGSVTINLVKGQKYSFLFLAEKPGQEIYSLSADGKSISVDYAAAKSLMNDEAREFFYVTDVIETVTGPLARTEVLTRPIAQINLGAVEGDIDAAVAAGLTRDGVMTDLVITATLPTKLDLFSGETSGSASVVTFAQAALTGKKLVVSSTNYDYVAYAAVLAPKNKMLVDLAFTVNSNLDPISVNVANVPIRRNYRTNILGHIFTAAAKFDIVVDPDYAGDTNYPLTDASTFSELNSALTSSNGAEVTLVDNISGNNVAFGVISSANSVLNLNGFTYTNNRSGMGAIMVRGSANLEINGPGSVANTALAPIIWNSGTGTITINGGTFETSVHSESIYCEKGTIEITGGTFKALPETSDGICHFTLNCKDANYNAGTAKIIVKGGTFYNFNPADNLAEGAGTNFVADGYKVTSKTSGSDTIYTVVPE